MDAIFKLNEDIQNEGFLGSINKKQYDYFKKLFKSNRTNLSKSKNDIENLITKILKSIVSIYNNFININKIKNLDNVIERTFIKDELKVGNKNSGKAKITSEKILNNKNFISTLKKLGSIFTELKMIEPDHNL